ncbi:uncharacterized protein LOC108864526 [Galendromus occidentalis]|uniref:Uncharacterized protein LOC108864526 n=1 Tax=Galendromus occidentalis TaxID=34638 RepID=A0AAJ7L4W6_9ACAR|nr:uncharacterized protein LOC108864526 [Galendromus occidentalis]
MNLETHTFNLSPTKNEFKCPSENITSCELVYLFGRCQKKGTLDEAIRVPERQDHFWGHGNMSQSRPDRNSTGAGAQRTPGSRGNTHSNPESARRCQQVEEAHDVSQNLAWNPPVHDAPEVPAPADDNWLMPENFEDRFFTAVELIGDREQYTPDEYVREWLSDRQGITNFVVEPVLWHIHRLHPPGFILSTPEFPEEKTLMHLLRTFRHPYLAYRKQTICVFVESPQIETLVEKLRAKKIPVVVLTEDTRQEVQGSNSVFLATHARNVGNLPVDNVVNYKMFRTASQYVDRLRLLRRRGHMTTFFNPAEDSRFVPALVQEMREQKIEVPAFLKDRLALAAPGACSAPQE